MDEKRADEDVYTFTLYADYLQFYLGDSLFEADTEDDFWTDEADARHLAIDPPGLIAVGTDCYGYVPVRVEVCGDAPTDETTGWDRITEASLAVPSGSIAIDGCLSYMPEVSYRQMLQMHPDGEGVRRSPHIPVEPGTYRVRVYAGATGTQRAVATPAGPREVTDEHYRLVLWPAPYTAPTVMHVAE